jgi:CubicO group peptidase (beta-lactamase class C family)
MSVLAAALLTLAGPGDDLAGSVDSLVARWDSADSPGGAIAVRWDGEPALVRTFGMADLEAGLPVSAETPFYLASLAKPFTAACAMHASRAGALDLDASVLELFPELPESYRAATLRHCLHHRSGIPDVYDAAIGADLGAEVVASNAAAIELLTRLPHLNFEPGARFLYSNSGYVLLAEALHRATGEDLAAYARVHVFEPLEMHTAGYLGDDGAPYPARAYDRSGAGWTPKDLPTGMRGPGGMVASLDDLVKWSAREPHPDLLQAPEGPHHPRLGSYAAGWMLLRMGGQRVQRHFGGAFGNTADFLRFPDAGLTVVALSNCAELDAADLAPELARLALGERFADAPGPAAVELTEAQRARFARLWREPATGALWVLTPRPDRFVWAGLGDMKLELVPVNEMRLEALESQAPFALELDDDGLRIEHDGTSTPLEALPFPPRDVAPLEDYVGDYESAALDAFITLEDRGGRLALRQERPLLELPPFHALGQDTFLCDRGAVLRFKRDEDGRVVEVTMDTNRTWGLVFARAE